MLLNSLLLCVTALAWPAAAQSQDIRALPIKGDQVSDADIAQAQSTLNAEIRKLEIRIRAGSPDPKPGQITTTVSTLVAARLSSAMRRALVARPRGQIVLIAIAPQADPGQPRQLVLINVSSWIAGGRSLEAGRDGTFAILSDAKMQSAAGDTFAVEGIRYMASVANGTFLFSRAAGQ
jgi:hypothetical protein